MTAPQGTITVPRLANWSPDGEQLAFLSGSDISHARVRVVDAEGGVADPLTGGGGFSGPAWSPTGRRIAYLDKPVGCSKVRVMKPDGSRKRTLISKRDACAYGVLDWQAK